ncbi:MAG: hypothetical protein AB8D78_05125 [Akkermansiaceae bacterium]
MKPTEEPIQICVIGPDRAGTTHFCSLFESVGNVHTSRDSVLYEVLKYNGKKPYEEKKLIVDSFLEQARASGKPIVLYKLMYHQMTPEDLRKFFLPDEKMLKIVITRNILDMYISHRKAKKVKSWQSTDTSKVKIWFNYRGRFMAWARERIDYLKELKRELDAGGYRPLLVDYSDLHAHKDDLSKLQWVAKRIRDEYGIELEMAESVVPSVEKQDKGTSYRDKVYNYRKLQKMTENRDLELRKIFEGPSFDF